MVHVDRLWSAFVLFGEHVNLVAKCNRVMSCLVLSCLAWLGLAWSVLTPYGQVRSGLAWYGTHCSGLVSSGHAWQVLARFRHRLLGLCLFWSVLVRSGPVLLVPHLPCSVGSGLVEIINA